MVADSGTKFEAAAEPTSNSKATTSSTNKIVPIVPKPSGPHRLYEEEGVIYGDWRDELARDGFVVVKGAVPKERADKYADDILTYLEEL